MHYYKILKHKAGFDEGTNYWEKILARYLAATGGGKILTTLPITFTSTSWKLAGWTVYGNNHEHSYSAEGTLPLVFTSHTAGAASDWEIEGNDNVGQNLVNVESAGVNPKIVVNTLQNSTGTIWGSTSGGANYIAFSLFPLFEEGKTYTISFNNLYTENTTSRVTIRRKTTYNIRYSTALTTYGKRSFSFTYTAAEFPNGAYISIILNDNTGAAGELHIENLMLVEGSTIPSTFEPYQIGVGQRTKNLFNATIEQGGLNSGSEYNSSTRIRTTFMPNMLDAGTYTVNASGLSNVVINYFDDNKTYTGGVTTWRTLPFTFNISNRCYVRFAFRASDSHDITPSDISNIMLVEGSTSSANFVPYGYEIPLNVNATTQDIYIGDSPLTAGQSISKTSTGVDIAAMAGSNTITTELYNKPSMSIEGVDYVGVGEPANDGWQIPLTVTHYTDNIFDKDAKNTNKGYEDSTCIMWAGSIPYPYMTGNEDNNYFVSEKIPASPNTTYYLTDGIFKNTGNGIYSVFLWNRYRMSDYQAFPTEKTFTTGDDTKFIQLCVLKAYADTVMITTKPTETYIPHVEVNNVNVLIGDSPLTEGQTVSNTQEIEVFKGENTIDTTLYNKPVMEIEYE